MTSQEAIARARSHSWVEVNDQTEMCHRCKIILPKSTNLENVPGCIEVKIK